MDDAANSRLHPRYGRIVKRSIGIAGHRTSVSLEEAFWRTLRAIAYIERVNTSTLVADIGAKRGKIGLSSAIRQFVLFYSQNKDPAQAKLAVPKRWGEAATD
jgi:predicted DNA-binding ribbon-helix-helix protein